METDELIKITRRVCALEALYEEGAMDRRDLEQALGVSKPTVHRFARFLGEQGLVVRVDGRFRLTPLGKVVAEETIRFRDTVDGIQKLRRISQWLPVEAFDFDLRRFHDANIVFPDCSDPFAPIRKASTLLDTARRVRVVSSVYLPETFATLCRGSIENGSSVACVYDRRVLDVIRADEQARSNLERLLARGVVVAVHPDIPFSLFIADETVLICAVDDRGVPKALVVTEDTVIRDWAEESCESYRHEAEPVAVETDALAMAHS